MTDRRREGVEFTADMRGPVLRRRRPELLFLRREIGDRRIEFALRCFRGLRASAECTGGFGDSFECAEDRPCLRQFLCRRVDSAQLLVGLRHQCLGCIDCRGKFFQSRVDLGDPSFASTRPRCRADVLGVGLDVPATRDALPEAPVDADRDAGIGVARCLDETDRRENVLYPSVGYVGIAFDLEDVGQRSSLRALLDRQSGQELLTDVIGNRFVGADPAVQQICRLECGFDSRSHVWFD